MPIRDKKGFLLACPTNDWAYPLKVSFDGVHWLDTLSAPCPPPKEHCHEWRWSIAQKKEAFNTTKGEVVFLGYVMNNATQNMIIVSVRVNGSWHDLNLDQVPDSVL